MLVIFLVARVTLLAQFGDREELSCVAGNTLGAAVFSTQRKFGIDIVVERCALPEFGTVTCLALFAKLPPVTFLVVHFLVTGKAVARRFTIVGVLVAFRTFHIQMLTSQGETRLVMVELGFFPGTFLMAAFALGSQLALVHVVLLVTRIAFVRCGTEFLSSQMAFGTFGLLMLALKDEIRQCVVKLLLVQHHNPAVASLVLGMTDATSLLLRFLPVKSGISTHIGSNFLVTVDAQPVLRLAVELHMTLLAVVFPLHMPLNQFPRRDNGLDSLRHCSGSKEHCTK